MEAPANDKENLLENPTPRRMTRLAKSLMMRDLPGNVTIEDKPASDTVKPVPVKTSAKTPRKTPNKVAKDTSKKTPKKTSNKVAKDTPTKSSKKTPNKVTKDTPKKTPRKTPGKAAEEPKPSTESASKGSRSAKKSEKKATPGTLRVTRSRSIGLESREQEAAPASRKNLFPDDVEKDQNFDETFQKSSDNKNLDETFQKSSDTKSEDQTEKIEKVDDLEAAEVKETEDGGDEILPEEMFKEALGEENASSTPEKSEKSGVLDEKVDETEKKEQVDILADLADGLTGENLADQSCVIIDDSFKMDKIEDCDPGSKSIIVIPDTPMPVAGDVEHALNETFSAEPEGIFFPLEEPKRMEKKTPKKTPFKATKSPKRLNLLSTSKMVHFSPAIASSALKSSILMKHKTISPLKSIRKRSFSTNDVESTKKMNRVTFHSPANMEITVDEIDGEMQPHIEEIRLERDAFVALRAKNKLARRHKRSMSNAETESGRKRALHNLAGQKTPTKAEPVALGKVPNFMAIHAASFKKMENLVEYKNRKDERAKNLLSNSGKSLNYSTSAVPKEKDQSDNNKQASAIPVLAKVVQSGPSKSTAEGETKAAHVGTSRPLKKVEERQQKWRSMHKSGRHDNNTESKTGQKSAILKGVRSNRRFDLMMKFREQN